jgi:uncharacterized protein YjbI with pentapeptide repeats
MTQFSGADLAETDFSGATLEKSDLSQSNLAGALFAGATVRDVNTRAARAMPPTLKGAGNP